MPAQIAEAMLAKGPGCHHVEVTGRYYAGGAVNACVSLVKDFIDSSVGSKWRWRAEVFDDQGWDRTWYIGEPVKSNDQNLFMPDVTITSPAFEIAIVPFTRAWSEIMDSTLRVSLWREYARLAQGLSAYDEDWLDKLNASKFDGRMLRHIAGVNDGWGEADMKKWLSAMKQIWSKTPEGFFEAKSKKTLRL